MTVALLAIAVYLPGLPGGFVFDDGYNIVDNPLFRSIPDVSSTWKALWQASWSSAAGPFHRPLAMFSLALNYLVHGPTPLGFKIVNIAIHAINAVLVYHVMKRILIALEPALIETKQAREASLLRLAWMAAALWAVHPLNLTSVLYIVQRMTSLSALFSLVGFWIYLGMRARGASGARAIYGSLFLVALCGLASALSKESGLLMFAYLFVLECCLFRFRSSSYKARSALIGFFGITLAVPLAAVGYDLLIGGWLLHGYGGRDFDLTQRLLTEARALWFYLHMFVSPSLQSLALYHDDFPISTDLLHPRSTLFSVAGVALLASSAWLFRRGWPAFSLGIIWFLAGHLMESTVVPLELVYEHRNYLPSLGIILILVDAINRLAAAIPRYPSLSSLTFGTFFLLTGGVTVLRAHAWADPITQLEIAATDHPGSTRTHHELAVNYVRLNLVTENPAYLSRARRQLLLAVKADPNNIAAIIGVVMVDAMKGMEPTSKQIAGLSYLLRTHRLSAVSLLTLHRLVSCQIDGRCDIENRTVLRLVDSVLAHPNLTERYRTPLIEARKSLFGARGHKSVRTHL